MNIQLFNNPKFGEVRVTEIDGKTYFIGSDVAKCLGYSNPHDAIIRHCKSDGVVNHEVIDSLGRTQAAKFISEGNIYRLAAKSQLPGADEFESWIFDEVLPSIRKNGMYATTATLENMIADPDFAIQLLTNLKLEKQKRVEAETQLTEQAPKVLFTDAVIGSKSSCLIGELAKIISQKGVPIGQNRLFKWLRKNGYLGTRGENYNIPNQRYVEQGLFELKKGTRSGNDGVMYTTITPKVTGRGQVYFVNKFLKTKHLA